jgi:phage tail-like protein
MDANGARAWSLQHASDWPTLAQADSAVAWNSACSALRLASTRVLPEPVADAAAIAQQALQRVPRALDAQGNVATWHAPSRAIVVRSHLPQAAIAFEFAAEEVPTDVCVGHDSVLYVALADRVRLIDLRRRWEPVDVPGHGFAPWRLAAHPRSGVWALERHSGRLARVQGQPLPLNTPHALDYAPGVFRPNPENPNEPVLQVIAGAVSGVAVPHALASHPEGGLALLGFNSNAQAWLQRWDDVTATRGERRLLAGAFHAYALTWLDAQRIAVRLPAQPDAPSFAADTPGGGEIPALGEVHPLAADRHEAPFAHRIDGPPHYPVRGDASEPLLPLGLPHFARRGEVANHAIEGDRLRARWIDSGTPATVWHRLNIEASLPPGCALIAWLAATNDPEPPAPDALADWHPHAFGRDARALDEAARAPQVPLAAWERAPSELPAHPGLARWAPLRDERGLFGVLVQNARQRTRGLQGRYLWVRLVLHGDGRRTPELVALRAWGSRFNLAEQYLPRLYRETLFGDAAREPGDKLDSINEGHAAALDAGGAPDPALLLRLAQGGIEPGEGAQVTVERAGRSWLLRDGASARQWRLQLDGHAIGVYRPRATPADFLARFLANTEGVLTTLEDRVAHAHLLSDPTSAPAEGLDWLAGWVGIAFDPALPEARRRDWLRAAGELARWHGTRRGLLLALDVATGGAVRGGEVIVLEDFRLRRVLGTLLGVDLADEDDPLLPGLQISGNSVVGDTLQLAEEQRAELMALYREEATSAAEDAALAEWHGRLAHRATVLVHREVDDVDLGLVRRIVELEAPAHVEVRVLTARWPFMVGVGSLVGVDSYLARTQPLRPVRVQRSVLGTGDFVIAAAALDPRLRGGAAAAVDIADDHDANPDAPTPRTRRTPRRPA